MPSQTTQSFIQKQAGGHRSKIHRWCWLANFHHRWCRSARCWCPALATPQSHRMSCAWTRDATFKIIEITKHILTKWRYINMLKIDPKLKIIEMWWKTSMNLGGRFFHKKRLPSSNGHLKPLDLLRAPGPHDDGVRCVCLVHQLSSPAMRFSGNPWEQKLPPDVLFFRKKTTRALLPGRFSAKIGKKPFFTFSENGTLLITYGFCGGVPTQNWWMEQL